MTVKSPNWKNLRLSRGSVDQVDKAPNLDDDLINAKWICDKVKNSDIYAQNLYAAICNQIWQKQDIWAVLKDITWCCSWRYASGIIADMREDGDYMDWYCSGIGNAEVGYGLTGADGDGYISEGRVSEEILSDLLQLGWVPIDDPDDVDGI